MDGEVTVYAFSGETGDYFYWQKDYLYWKAEVYHWPMGPSIDRMRQGDMDLKPTISADSVDQYIE